MFRLPKIRPAPSLRRAVTVAMLAGGACLAAAMPASADEASAKQLLKSMSDYLVSQKAIAFDYDTNLELVTSDLEKIGMASSGSVAMSRPDKIRVTRTGGTADVEFAYDGKTLTVLGKRLNVFAKLDRQGSVEDLIDTLRFEYGLELPAADLLSANPYDALMSNVTAVKDLGSGFIRGQECDHLAFRTQVTDWQIWIAQGDKPYPCRLTITSKMMAQGPTYTFDVTAWKDGTALAADAFQIDTGSAKEADIGSLSGLDEAPAIGGEGEAE